MSIMDVGDGGEGCGIFIFFNIVAKSMLGSE